MCTKKVRFQLNYTIYRQIDGVAMEGLIGYFMGDISMRYLENTVLK